MLGNCVAPYPPGYQPITKPKFIQATGPHSTYFRPKFSRFYQDPFLIQPQSIPIIPKLSNCHHVMSLCLCQSVIHLCHLVIHLFTKLIRLHMDNIYVNKLTMKQLTTYAVIHICKLVHSCKHWTSAEYIQTKNIN